jgi:hypothetical protein
MNRISQYISLFLAALFLAGLTSISGFDTSQTSTPNGDSLKNGDIIFQTSLSSQSMAIQLATDSKYSHCGIIFEKDHGKKNWHVLEAVQPVKWTPLQEFIDRGTDGHCVIKRSVASVQTNAEILHEMKTYGESHVGKDYDLAFGWGDDKLYCSELVWKCYSTSVGIELSKLRALGDFDLSHPLVQKELVKRYGDKIPLEEKMVSPGDIYESKLLRTVFEN